MGFNTSKFLPPIMDYNSLNLEAEGTVTSRNPYLTKYPKPPRKRKREIYDPDKYKNLNERKENTPKNLLDVDVKNLVQYLIKSCTNDLEKVYTLFYWITSESLFVTPQKNLKKYSATWYLNKIFTGHGNFAHFFYILCWYAEIPCVIIGGTTKNSAYKIGFSFVTADMEAQWNAVYVEDDWHLMSIQWACISASDSNDWKPSVTFGDKAFSSKHPNGASHQSHYDNPNIPPTPKRKQEYFYHVNDYYFLTDPDELIWTHFPNNKQWQLLDNPVTLEEFLGHFYVREQFYILGMSVTEKSHTDCVLLVDENRQVQIEFDLPPDCSSTYRFKYTLSHHWSSWPLEKQESLLQLGKYEVIDNRFYLTLRFTSKGIYKLDIFGSESQHSRFYLVCSYVVKCSYIAEGAALPSKFFLGYGSGVKPLEKKLQTNDGRIKLPFPIERDAAIMHILSHKGKVVEGGSLVRMLDDDHTSDMVTMIIELRLPEPGKYSLRVYEKKKAERKDLCDYIIIYNKDLETSLPAPVGPTTKNSSEFQQNKIVVLSHPGSFIQTNLNSLKILFRSEHQLSCRLYSNFDNPRCTKKLSVLHDMVTKECQFNVNIPTCGDYILRIFAKFIEKTVPRAQDGQFHELHSYKIRKLDSDTFSVDGIETDRENSVYIVGTFETDHLLINIAQLDFTDETLLVVQYKNGSSVSSNRVNVVDVSNLQTVKDFEKVKEYGQKEDKSYIQVALPHIGDYLLSLLKRDPETGLVKKVTRYLIRRKQCTEQNNGDKKNNLQREAQKDCEKCEQEPNQKKNENNKIEETLENECQIPTKTIKPIKIEETKTIKPINIEEAKTVQESKQPNEKKKKFGFIASKSETGKGEPNKIEEPPPKIKLEPTKKSDYAPPPPPISKAEVKSKQIEVARTSAEFSDINLLHELEFAIAKGNTQLLKSALSRSEKYLNYDIVKRAQNLLDMLQAKQDLIQAYGARDKELLDTALQNAQRVNFEDELNEEIAVAQSLYKRLCELDNLRSSIGTLDYRAVSEVKSYSKPPTGVIVVMRSVFLILNVPENELKEWKQIRALMRNIQNPFIRRILNCSPRCVSLESVNAAEETLGTIEAEDISCVSEMATILFFWAKKMIEEAKNQELNIDLANLNKK